MKKLIIALLLLPFFSKAQNSFIAFIKTEGKQEVLEGVTVTIKKLKLAGISDSTGKVQFNHIPDGTWEVVISSIGYKELEKEFVFPLNNAAGIIQIYLEPSSGELGEVTVSSTRSNRSIRNTPTRVEVIAEEEVHEEAAMRPGDIRMLLAESTGIQTQQTSATTGNADIRIQGLDGRYTQILKDGFSVYSGAAGGLGLLQTPPLDLRQVEIIKVLLLRSMEVGQLQD